MKLLLVLTVFLVSLTPPLIAQQSDSTTQLRKEQALVRTLKNAMTCKNMQVYEKGDLYCTIDFRGLRLEFAGVNAPGGGAIYVTSLGKNQTIGMRGSRCMTVGFSAGLRGITDANVLFRDDGTITHVYQNREAWQSCER